MLAEPRRPLYHDIALFPWHIWWLLPNGAVSFNKGDLCISLSSKVNKIHLSLSLSHTHTYSGCVWSRCRNESWDRAGIRELKYVFMFNLFTPECARSNRCCFAKCADWEPRCYFRKLDVNPGYGFKKCDVVRKSDQKEKTKPVRVFLFRFSSRLLIKAPSKQALLIL